MFINRNEWIVGLIYRYTDSLNELRQIKAIY